MLKKIIGILLLGGALFFAYGTYAYYTVSKEYSQSTMNFLTGTEPEVPFPYQFVFVSAICLISGLFLLINNNKSKRKSQKYF